MHKIFDIVVLFLRIYSEETSANFMEKYIC